MDLLIDIGNTRIKWAMHRDQELDAMQAANYKTWNEADVRAHLLNNVESLQRVWISNVAGDTIAALVTRAIFGSTAITPTLVRSTASACGVTNGYKLPDQLGVDRWLAVIAAYGIIHDAVCVVSVGTAMTIDGVSPHGKHLGGVIVPGPEMMMNGLMQNTSDIADRANINKGVQETTLFATNTLAAMHQGTRHALTSSIESALASLAQQTCSIPTLIVTGGAIDWLDSLQVAYRSIPDLVLRGLAMVSQDTLNLAIKNNENA